MIFGCGHSSEGQLGIGCVEEEQILLPRKICDTPVSSKPEFIGGKRKSRQDSDPSTDIDALTIPGPSANSTAIPGLGLLANVKQIACGSHHTLFLTENGSVLSCGNNDHGQLGHEGPRTTPTLVAPIIQEVMIRQVSAGATHSAALAENGLLYTWGNNAYGQLGTPVSLDEYNVHPVNVEVVGSKFSDICCGGYHTLALATDGVLYSWGLNHNGQLGLGTTKDEPRPKNIRSLSGVPFRQISAGEHFSFALSMSGAIFSWGKNSHGQLGTGDLVDRSHPFHVKQLRHQQTAFISSGAMHTAALTHDGRLFTFGCATYGQLGHNANNNEEFPRQVMELMGSRVARVACGRCHTVAMVGQRVYAFGLGDRGQLGQGSPDVRLLPTRMRLFEQGQSVAQRSLGNPDNMLITGVYAGGDQTFIRAQFKDWSREPSPDPRVSMQFLPESIKYLTSERLRNLLSGPKDRISIDLSQIFASSACINCSFLKPGLEHYGASKKNHGVLMDDVWKAFNSLRDNADDRLTKTITESVELKLLPELSSQPPDIEALRIYLILPWLHIFDDPARYRTLHTPFATAMSSLSKIPAQVLEHWWSTLEIRHFNRVLKIFKEVVAHVIAKPTNNATPTSTEMALREITFRGCLRVLAKLKTVNQSAPKVPYDLFYIREMAEKVDIRQEYIKFMFRRDESVFSFCDYPFIFDATVKTMLLQTDANVQMQLMVDEANRHNLQSIFVPVQPQVSPFLILNVSRNNIVHDTITQLLSINSQLQQLDLKKPMKVKFHDEEADDAGGVKKEFFMLLFAELLDVKYGMFKEYEDSKSIWFNAQTFEEAQMYTLVGMLFGLAIYNSVLVNWPFPIALYKKILKQSVGLEDMRELSPVEARSLEQMLEYEADDFEDVFDLNFQISVFSFGATIPVDLKPNGGNITVTKENRQEYVEVYVKYILDDSIRSQFDAFSDGFHRVVTSRILNFFQPRELMEMAVGNENYDWDAFEKNTEYKGEYWRRHETIQHFWDVFHELNLEQKKKFLVFLTGSDRIPLLGMKMIKLTIQPTSGGDDYHPAAHTCFNLLDLPRYKTRAKLREKLLHSIEHVEGFTLV